MRRRVITVNDKMQQGCRYFLTEPIGRNFDPKFMPELTPKEMLALGVFGGKYMNDCRKEFPSSWFTRAKISPAGWSGLQLRTRDDRVDRCGPRNLYCTAHSISDMLASSESCTAHWWHPRRTNCSIDLSSFLLS